MYALKLTGSVITLHIKAAHTQSRQALLSRVALLVITQPTFLIC